MPTSASHFFCRQFDRHGLSETAAYPASGKGLPDHVTQCIKSNNSKGLERYTGQQSLTRQADRNGISNIIAGGTFAAALMESMEWTASPG
jgi:hypothetical protein